MELNKERVKFEYFKNSQKLLQIDLKLKEIRKYIEDKYPYYGKENVIYDNNMEENDETQPFEIKNVENNLEEENEIYDNNIEKENGAEIDNLEDGDEDYSEKQNQYNNNYNSNIQKQNSDKSKQILTIK